MRGEREAQRDLVVTVTPDELIPRDHPIRVVKRIADEALKRLEPKFEGLYSNRGRPSIPPEVLLKAQVLIAEQFAPVLARLPKTVRGTLGTTAWLSLHSTIATTFAAMNDGTNPGPRLEASAHFDTFKWNLRLLVSQKLVSPGWLAGISPDLGEAGRMIGGMVRATRRTPAF